MNDDDMKRAARVQTFVCLALISGLLVAGCGKKTDAASLVRDYWSQENCADRVKFILAPEANGAALVNEYKDQKSCVKKLDSIDDADCKTAAAGSYCSLQAKSGKDTNTYCMKNDDGAFKIDWRCTKGFNPTPMAVFKAQLPETPSVFRVEAKISDFYNFEYTDAQKSHHSVGLVAGDTGERVYGYIQKDSPEGQTLFELLKDGRSHRLTIELVYPKNARDSHTTTIKRLVAKDWHQQAEEK
jgi:hypothetical protein